MTREIDNGARWRALFEEHHMQLTEVAEILLDRCGSPEQILQKAFAGLEHYPFYEPFGQISAVRAVVKAAIANNYTSVDSWILTAPSGPISYEHSGLQPLEAVPWAERAAYFLHEVLHYSRRDTALLLGISDAKVDELNKFAKKRMGLPIDARIYAQTTHSRQTRAVGSAHSMAFATYE